MPSFLSQIPNYFPDPVFIAFAVLILDCISGDPAWIYSRIPHPVVIIGQIISLFEKRLNRAEISNFLRFVFGTFTTLSIIGIILIVGYALTSLLEVIPGGVIVLIIISSSLIAYRGLYDGVCLVEKALGQSLASGQTAVSHIVGRDPNSLDEAGVSRAAIESLAENFSDGTVAPIFWFLLFGLPGLMFYKAVNTLDSMIGHHNERYEYFGKFAARLDDIVNYIPARLTGILLTIAAFILPKANGNLAFRGLLRDAKKHKSVNAGWQEAALAGGLGLSLAGPRKYGDQIVDDVWMNEQGRKDAMAQDIKMALQLYIVSGVLLLIVLAGLALNVMI